LPGPSNSASKCPAAFLAEVWSEVLSQQPAGDRWQPVGAAADRQPVGAADRQPVGTRADSGDPQVTLHLHQQ